ncbi:MAG: OmpL47-type beta-barrel domain-containing protein [Actinomycetota bacterium]
MSYGAGGSSFSRMWAKRTSALSALVAIALMVGMLPAYASTVSSAGFSGGAGTASVGGTLYAKSGGALTLTVTTSDDTKCVEVSGAHSARQTSNPAKSSWTFSFTAGAGDGVRSVTAAASSNFNANGCTGQSQSPRSASYTLDNTGPVVTGSLSPAPNAAGWNRTNVTINWTAADAGSGVKTGPIPASDSVNTPGTTTKSSSATDELGNTGSGAVTVKLDKGAPTISGSRSPAANSFGWNNSDVTVGFTCSDPDSGIKSCTGSTTKSSEGANQAVVGTAVDNADNSASTTVDVSIDKTTPTLNGAPTTTPNTAGWYKNNVTIDWSASDALSGIDPATDPADSVISGEGTGLTASASVKDKAGNQTGATSTAVKIDKTAPNTTTSAPSGWTNSGVTLALSAGDNLSGVDSTKYRLDGGTVQTGTSVSISNEGLHGVDFWSVDRAGNVESAKTVEVKIDKTAPMITHHLAPAVNDAGWNNSAVTVTFVCGDALSGVASCSSPREVTGEGKNQVVNGTARDNAGNEATDAATVSIDKSAPTISAARDRAPNALGWYRADVFVSFTCVDQAALSGVLSCSGSQTVGEGRNQSVTGTAEDKAGNRASVSETGINVDKTAPTLSGKAFTEPNEHGWYSGDVIVGWSCDDALSGISSGCPESSRITGEGASLSASASVSDDAGNPKTTTVDGVRIDRNAPTTSADVAAPLASGWYAGDVRVSLSAVDVLSGIDKTYYSIDGGNAELYSGPFHHALRGEHTIAFWSVDKAGNVEDKDAPGHSITLKIDGIAPTISGSRAPGANAFGWNNTDVTVSFFCSDGESGLAVDCPAPTTRSAEGADQSVTGSVSDIAGNSSSATVGDINIDKKKPSLSGKAATEPNEYGWYKSDVTVQWTADDELSGVAPASVPADSTVGGEGKSLSAGPVSVLDKAGNEASASLGGLNVDRTAPAITGAVTYEDGTRRGPNAAGWYNTAVRVRFKCSDALSGLARCPEDTILLSDGAGQRVAGEAIDVAGNLASSEVTGINIDSKAPQTAAELVCTSRNDWCRGDSATVRLSASDQAGLSGVKEIHYSVNGGNYVVAEGNAVSVRVPLDNRSGTANVAYFAVDAAGNAELEGSSAIKYDNIAPTLTPQVTPKPNAAGWNNSDATVRFSASDDEGGSGIDAASVTPDVLVDQETAGRLVGGSAEDRAGNASTASVEVKLDKTKPSITGAALQQANDNGWHRGPVTVHFECDDELSGIVDCTDDVVLSDDDKDQSAHGKALDRAGNEAGAKVDGINIDSVAPETHADVAEPLKSGWYSGPVEVTLRAADSLSGVDNTYYGVDAGAAQLYSGPFDHALEGEHTIVFWSVDKAGNAEERHALELRVDDVKPNISGSRTPAANSYGWNNERVDVHFVCDDEHSGIAGCTPDTPLTNEGAGQEVSGEALDNAGNRANALVKDINIDLSKPTLEGVADRNPNAAGWYNDDVSIAWRAHDALSGIDPSSVPDDSTIDGEGDNLSAGPVSVLDKAGNSRSASISGINIDRTAPTISGRPTTPANSAGWYKATVTVQFTCADNLSGVASCPSAEVLSGDGADQSVTSGPARDLADNTRAGKTIGGINIDGRAPVTTADTQCTKVNEWCTGSSASIVLSATDQAGLSGVKEIHYRVNGGEEQVAQGSTKTVNVALDGSGEASVRFYAVDVAGNAEAPNAVALTYDNIAPAMTHSVSPKPNAADWNNSNVTVHFDAKDNDGGSGIDASRTTSDVLVDQETSGAGRSVVGEAYDLAGNRSSDAVTVKLDKTKPSISGAPTTQPNWNGWYGGSVTVKFNCSDGLSGIPSGTCPQDVILTSNGVNEVTRSVVDAAGNAASVTVSGIKIDAVAPSLQVAGLNDGDTYTLGAVPRASCNASDAHSGLAEACKLEVAGGLANGVGTFNYTATAVDKAGKRAEVRGSYKVVYRWDGYLQPINDTAHQVGTSTSIFKAGSTVPVKFQLKRSDGSVVQANSAPAWLTPAKGSATTAAVDESVYSAATTSGDTYRWDATAQQYIYNWSTKGFTAGYYYRVGVKLDDGQTYYVNIGVR